MASSARLKPGQMGKIIATVDTRGKIGRIVKTIEVLSNDRLREKVILKIVLDVEEDITHKGALSKGIFSEGCAECHVEKGRGKLGKELFLADCAMCHPANSDEKGIGQPITILRHRDAEYLRQVIQNGIRNSMMPGFAEEMGGPLDYEEIESLIQYIKTER